MVRKLPRSARPGVFGALGIDQRGPGADGALYGITSWAVVITLTTVLLSFLSPYMELLLAGTITHSSNWLVLSIFAFGAFLSTLGGYLGRTHSEESLSLQKPTPERLKSASNASQALHRSPRIFSCERETAKVLPEHQLRP